MRIVKTQPQLILHAPNVHTGGGLSLLKAVFSATNLSISWMQIDQRAKKQLQLPSSRVVEYVNRSLFSRCYAEWRLWQHSKENDTVLCFHGLPPLFRLRGQVVVFLQNKILLSQDPITGYPLYTKIRLLIERKLLQNLSSHVNKFIVQTPSMARNAKITLGDEINIVVLPFAAASTRIETHTSPKQFDFIYIASDEFHKNHTTLLEAWHLLAKSGQKPSLALTVATQSKLASEMEHFKKQHDLNISNLGTVTAAEVHQLYQTSSALIFPSTTESLGLPLIEASQYGLPILASELDYVRDVVQPVQTFDPYSPLSIARAVMRFLDKPEPLLQMKTPEDFLVEVLK